MKKTIFFLCLTLLKCTFSLKSEGFHKDTLVLTPYGQVRIDDIVVGDEVISYHEDKKVISTIQAKFFIHTPNVRSITLKYGQKITVHPNHRFWLPTEGIWKRAHELTKGDLLYREDDTYHPVIKNKTKKNESFFITLTTYPVPNFFVSSSNILVHNLAPLVSFGLVWTFGEGVSWIVGSGLISACVAYIGNKLASRPKFIEPSYIHCNLKDAKDHDAQAPGKPEEVHGYIPPRNHDGKKSPDPNGGRKPGWKDKKGDVWIPTGPQGHGDPHWDVQDADGKGGYRNVYPNGTVRRGR